jgi:SAM-dependent methyltransferase
MIAMMGVLCKLYSNPLIRHLSIKTYSYRREFIINLVEEVFASPAHNQESIFWHQHTEIKMLLLKRPLLLLLTIIGLTTLGIQGCTQLQDLADAETGTQTSQQTDAPTGSVPYVPTPQNVVDRMLQVANVTKNDVVYDLGSGDGRIVVTAAQKYGARGVGIDINPTRIQEANANAQRAGVTDRVQFRQQDLFQTDLNEATVVTLYLLSSVNEELRPKLLSLRPGSRIVSHSFDMGDWKPEQTIKVNGSTIYSWRVPETVPANLRK